MHTTIAPNGKRPTPKLKLMLIKYVRYEIAANKNM